MKTLIILILSLVSINFTLCQQGHFRVKTNEFVQIGYDAYKTLTFGASTGSINNGSWALEHWANGLNIWRPWPTYNSINYALFIRDANGFTGIGKYPYHKLDVNGDIATYGTVRVYSDENLKVNITKLQPKNCLALISKINAYSYNLKSNHIPNNYNNLDSTELTEAKKQTIEEEKTNTSTYNNQEETLRNGFMAQEMEKIIPSLVKTDGDGNKSIDYIGLLPIMLEAMKEQQKEIEDLKNQIKKIQK